MDDRTLAKKLMGVMRARDARQDDRHRELVLGHQRLEKLMTEALSEFRADRERVRVIDDIVRGNGEPEKGLASRVPVLEKAEERRVWAIRTSLGAAIVALAKSFMPGG